MNKQIVKTGPNVAHSEVELEALSLMALGSLLGQRRAFAAIGGRCSAATPIASSPSSTASDPPTSSSSWLTGISPRTVPRHRARRPRRRHRRRWRNSLASSPKTRPGLLEAVDRILCRSGPSPLRDRTPRTLNAIANQLVELYSACPTRSGRDLIVEVATEFRLILMQPGTE